MKKIIILLVVALGGTTMNAANAIELKPFLSVCKSDLQSGMLRDKGQWVGTSFSNSTYIVKKLTKKQILDSTYGESCLEEINRKNGKLGGKTFTGGEMWFACYSIEREKAGFKDLDAGACQELYGKTGEITYISCDRGHFMFNPNQEFVRTPNFKGGHVLSGSKNEQYKTPLYISTGTCKVK